MNRPLKKPEISFLTEQQLKERIHQIPGMPVFYANHSRIAPSFFDVRVFLGQLNVDAMGEQGIQEHLCLILTPECTKLIAEGLLKALEQYQRLFGQLRNPPQLPLSASTGKEKKNKRSK
jgi:hypothetical protein